MSHHEIFSRLISNPAKRSDSSITRVPMRLATPVSLMDTLRKKTMDEAANEKRTSVRMKICMFRGMESHGQYCNDSLLLA